MDRRQYMICLGSLGIISTAGCLDVVTGDGPLTFEAQPHGIDSEIQDETGYEHVNTDSHVISEDFDVAGQTREVEVTNYIIEYEKSIELGPVGTIPAAVFTILSTPQVSIVGQEFNPVADMTTEDLATMAEEQYDEIEDLQHIEDSTVSVSSSETTQSKFSARTTMGGELIELHLHVTEAVEIGDDLVITVGGYPELTPEEEENIFALMEAVESNAA